MLMLEIFRRHVETIEKEAAEIKRDLEIARISALVDLYLEAQNINDPQAREAALSALRPLFDSPAHGGNRPAPR